MAERQHTTIAHVAKEAGVDNSTVSLALRGDPRITRATQEKVRAAAERMGYVPNTLARSLSSRHSRLIGVLLTDTENRFFASALDEFHSRAEAAGYTVSVKFSNWDPLRERTCLREFCEGRVDGLIWAATKQDDETLRDPSVTRLRTVGVPIISMGGEFLPDNNIAHNVGIHDADAVQCGVDYLTALGHRRIGIATAASAQGLRGIMHRDRINRVKAALAAHGLTLRHEDLLDTTDNQYGGVELSANLAKRPRPLRPTAIFACDDMLARALIAGLTAFGVPIPGEISVLGFDDAPGDTAGPVPVTSVSLEIREASRQTISLLLGLLNGSIPPRPLQSIVLRPRVIERSSCSAR